MLVFGYTHRGRLSALITQASAVMMVMTMVLKDSGYSNICYDST